jgi:hypothetical protein
MPRDITPAFQAALNDGEVFPALLLDIEFSDSELFLWNGIGDLLFNGDVYLGNGWFQGFGAVKEEGAMSPQGIDVTLTGIPTSLVSLILNQSVQNKFGRLLLGFLDSAGVIIQDPFLMYEGNLDVPQLVEDAKGPVIKISIENRLLDLDRPRDFRYTNESQKIFYEFDKGFEYVESLQDWEGYWGKKKETNKKRGRRRRRKRNRRRRG